MASSSSRSFSLSLSSLRRSLHAALLLIVILVNHVSADCYWPDGSTNLKHDPCGGANASLAGLCCAPGDLCLTSLLCSHVDGSNTAYYRGSCTSTPWVDSKGDISGGCANFCTDQSDGGRSDNQSGPEALLWCPGNRALWYCDNAAAGHVNCSTGDGTFPLVGPVSVFATVGGNFASATASGSMNPSPRTTASSSNTASSSTTTWTNNLTSPSVSIITVTARPLPSTPAPSTPPSEPQATAVPIAVGTSIGGVVAISAVVVAVLLVRSHRRNALPRAESPPPWHFPRSELDSTPLPSSGLAEADGGGVERKETPGRGWGAAGGRTGSHSEAEEPEREARRISELPG